MYGWIIFKYFLKVKKRSFFDIFRRFRRLSALVAPNWDRLPHIWYQRIRLVEKKCAGVKKFQFWQFFIFLWIFEKVEKIYFFNYKSGGLFSTILGVQWERVSVKKLKISKIFFFCQPPYPSKRFFFEKFPKFDFFENTEFLYVFL